MRHRSVRLLAAAIAVVLTTAVAAVIVLEPRVASQASPPAPATGESAAQLPATVQPPVSVPKQPVAATPTAPAGAAQATHLSTGWGVDISWPQCGPAGMPSLEPGFVVVGITYGKPFTENPCLARQLSWARTRTGVSAYANIDAPRSGDPGAYGRKVALDALARAERVGLKLPTLWLDVEVLNHWSSSGGFNVAVINGAIRALQSRGVRAGLYSSVPMWQQITGGAKVTVPVWLATSVSDYRQLPQWCDTGLGGRKADMTQYVATDGHQLVDVDVLCADAIPAVVAEFAPGR